MRTKEDQERVDSVRAILICVALILTARFFHISDDFSIGAIIIYYLIHACGFKVVKEKIK